MSMPRIAPLAPPYEDAVAEMLRKWMPPGAAVEPLRLFRTLLHHRLLGDRLRPVGAALLGKGTVSARERELVLLRTCARAGAEYEWGVHATAFAAAAEIGEREVAATVKGAPSEFLGDAALIALADELHDTATVSDATWGQLAARFSTEQLLELIAICGFYRLISYVVNAVGVAREPWAARFP
jgi:alkylhydroperoxidase family enzyme